MYAFGRKRTFGAPGIGLLAGRGFLKLKANHSKPPRIAWNDSGQPYERHMPTDS